MDFFIYDQSSTNLKLELNIPELLLVKEFKDLVNHRQEQGKDPFKDFTYIFLALDWKSPYSDYEEGVRHDTALADAELSEEDFEDEYFQDACAKYEEILNSNMGLRMLRTYRKTVDKMLVRTENTDFDREDEDGKYIHTTKELIEQITKSTEIFKKLEDLENMVTQGLKEKSSIKGDAQEGFDPDF